MVIAKVEGCRRALSQQPYFWVELKTLRLRTHYKGCYEEADWFFCGSPGDAAHTRLCERCCKRCGLLW